MGGAPQKKKWSWPRRTINFSGQDVTVVKLDKKMVTKQHPSAGRPLEEAARPVVNGLTAHLAKQVRPYTPPPPECNRPADGIFIAQAEMRALEQTNARMSRDMIALEKQNEELRGEVRRARLESETARERQRQRELEASDNRRDAERSARDAERFEAECRRLRGTLEEVQAAARARALAESRYEAELRRLGAEVDRIRRDCEAAVAARLDAEARLASAPVVDPTLEDRLWSAEAAAAAAEAEVRSAHDAAAAARRDADAARSEAAEARAARDKARRRHRVVEDVGPKKLPNPRKGGFGRLTTTDRDPGPTLEDELKRIARESRYREKLAHRRCEQLAERLKAERDRGATAEAMVCRLRANLDRAVKAAKHERDRCNRLKGARLDEEEPAEDEEEEPAPEVVDYAPPYAGPRRVEDDETTIPLAFRDSFQDDDSFEGLDDDDDDDE